MFFKTWLSQCPYKTKLINPSLSHKLPDIKIREGNYKYDKRIYTAEDAALIFYETLGYKGFLSQSHLWTTYLFIFFYEIVVDLSMSCYKWTKIKQEIFTTSFFDDNEDLIYRRISNLEQNDLCKVFYDTIHKYRTLQCSFLKDGFPTFKDYEEKFRIPLELVPKDKMLKCLIYLLMNKTRHQKGFPDLFIYKKKPDEYFLSEVKTENDKLLQSQRDWIKWNATVTNFPFELLILNQEELKFIKQ